MKVWRNRARNPNENSCLVRRSRQRRIVKLRVVIGVYNLAKLITTKYKSDVITHCSAFHA